MPMIDLAAIYIKNGEKFESAMTRFMDLLAEDGNLFSDQRSWAMVELSHLSGIKVDIALSCLEFLLIEDKIDFCRKLACRLAHMAIEDHAELLEDRIIEMTARDIDSLSDDEQIDQFRNLGTLAETYCDGISTEISGYALDVARAAIGDLDFCEITDPGKFILGAPRRVLHAWIDLAVASSPEVIAAERMQKAAIHAEDKWRFGTGLKFDFSSDEMGDGYHAVWDAVEERVTVDVEELVAEIVKQFAAGWKK